MLTLIFPGYSAHNKEWAEEVKKELEPELPVYVHEWLHWPTTDEAIKTSSFSLKKELKRLTDILDKEKQINILAKSVGVYVALNLIAISERNKFGKVILCGTATAATGERRELTKKALEKIPVKNLLCIQNDQDSYVTYKEAEKFYHKINSKIKIIEKIARNHNYPYYSDFRKFMTG
jgi:predicted alpha/beta hydrolase family esterase